MTERERRALAGGWPGIARYALPRALFGAASFYAFALLLWSITG